MAMDEAMTDDADDAMDDSIMSPLVFLPLSDPPPPPGFMDAWPERLLQKGHCCSCIFYTPYESDGLPDPHELGLCEATPSNTYDRPVQIWGVSLDRYYAVLWGDVPTEPPEPPELRKDGTVCSHSAHLIVTPEFGCVLWGPSSDWLAEGSR